MISISTSDSLNIVSAYEKVKLLNTELREENAKLKDQNNFLQNQHYQLAHDLKGPLRNQQVLLSMCNLDDTDEVVQHLKRSISQMEVLVRYNLTVNKSNEGNSLTIAVELEKVMADILVLLKGIISYYNVSIQADFTKAPSIFYQPLELQSILYNLIHNAIKYRHPNRYPQINVSSNFEGKYVCLKVQDNGQGMHLNSDSPSMLDKCTQLDTNQEGHGLGLYLVKEFLELRGGRIEMETAPEVGSTFCIFLQPQT
ncbi:ATP-binding protein [uncultured Microscilla sp.]|uniref:sensor histidine kinase n=1 Tax=uncultured Microscilla sp. TaxID=432653 RepID=UPI00260A9677|nr:HAMP domain-containing sensor histidine kinase [uncultured Microscilla sp.]